MNANTPLNGANSARPTVTELRLSAFKSHRGAAFPLGPLTLFAGASGSGKSSALQVYEALTRLGAGDELEAAFPDPAACVPEWAEADRQGRRGFRIGCTVDGPAGPVQLDLAVQAEPELRVVGERLTSGGRTLLTTALRDPGRSSVQAAWHTAGAATVTRAPLPDDRLGTALLPLRVAGKTEGQLRVLAAAEQVVVALRSAFACDPQPQRMREPVAAGEGRLRRGCDNLAEVLHRTRSQCAKRHARLAAAARLGCAGDVADVAVEELGDGTVRALLGRGGARGATPLGRLGEGELRYLALALVLLTGPGVLAMDQAAEVPAAYQSLTVLADGFDRCLDPRQARELVSLAAEMCARGHIRLVGAVTDASYARGVDGVTVVDLVA
ncbi:ATP-binding protein [Streptomyces lunaelactis]|uniref:AAA family ATPase n=1 Tax=Streptomyces lunaelactis TaxID=1535768 RepID=UPI001585399B|nr:ATP-binding protein [Streptomyces lunaelactis]NUK02660.1 ATP-binding protein [Streptomyces lunaelactis]NUK17229.1 ATP-binding protein [Streptomyces lunaelactis]NUK52112.1 ATP-binding protein [Streptomyces lunaelactis]NUK65613.1 ATP-binding protein [Streptomyces lunaelactis]NUK69672.1 ATP-binding protein [Streptomyces lunaelactis]